MKTNFFLLYMCLPESKIKNINVPSCINCANYNKNHRTCDLFGEKNIVTNEIDYELAYLCRKNEDMCGKNAKLFIDNKYHNKIMKFLNINNNDNYYIFIIYFMYVFSIYLIINN